MLARFPSTNYRNFSAVQLCHNPTVLKKIEEEVEALEATRLRLGGRIEKAKDYNFETALEQLREVVTECNL